MNPDYDPGRLDSLLQLLFDEALTGSDIDALNSILSESGEARTHYRKSLRLQCPRREFSCDVEDYNAHPTHGGRFG